MLASEMNVGLDDVIFVSSDTKENIDKLKTLIDERVD